MSVKNDRHQCNINFLFFLFTALSAPLNGKTCVYEELFWLAVHKWWSLFAHWCLFVCFVCNPADEESFTLFHGEDFHILLPSHKVEVLFQNRSAPRSKDVHLMRDGKVVHSRPKLDRTNTHLIIEAVGEGDEGVYIVKNLEKRDDVSRLSLTVRGTEDTLE